MTTVAMDQYVTYNAEYQVLICRQHGYCIPPEGITRHLRRFHGAIALQTRQAIIDYSKTLDLLTPEEVATPTEIQQPVSGLRTIAGFRCHYDGCTELRSTEVSIKQHCRETHEWKATVGELWSKQDFQTFFDGTLRK
jgi:hypothetical protein